MNKLDERFVAVQMGKQLDHIYRSLDEHNHKLILQERAFRMIIHQLHDELLSLKKVMNYERRNTPP